MPRPRTQVEKCSQPGCPNDAHSRGLCRCHYGRQWRGRPLTGPVIAQEAPSRFSTESLERQIADAKRAYALVVGFTGKLRWRHIIQELEQALNDVRRQAAAEENSRQSVASAS